MAVANTREAADAALHFSGFWILLHSPDLTQQHREFKKSPREKSLLNKQERNEMFA